MTQEQKLYFLKCKCLHRFFTTTTTSTSSPQIMTAARDGSELLRKVSNFSTLCFRQWCQCSKLLWTLYCNSWACYSVWYRDKAQQPGCKIPPEPLDGWKMEMLSANRETGSRLSRVWPSGLWFVLFLLFSLFHIFPSRNLNSVRK